MRTLRIGHRCWRVFWRMLFRMQDRVPFRVVSKMHFHLLPEFGVFESRLEPIRQALSPRRPRGQPRLDFHIGNWMLVFWFDRLATKTSEARRQSISKGAGHGIDKCGARTRGTD